MFREGGNISDINEDEVLLKFNVNEKNGELFGSDTNHNLRATMKEEEKCFDDEEPRYP